MAALAGKYGRLRTVVVGPDEVSVKRPIKGKSIVTLQTCTLPNYKDRLIVQAKLVSSN